MTFYTNDVNVRHTIISKFGSFIEYSDVIGLSSKEKIFSVAIKKKNLENPNLKEFVEAKLVRHSYNFREHCTNCNKDIRPMEEVHFSNTKIFSKVVLCKCCSKLPMNSELIYKKTKVKLMPVIIELLRNNKK